MQVNIRIAGRCPSGIATFMAIHQLMKQSTPEIIQTDDFSRTNYSCTEPTVAKHRRQLRTARVRCELETMPHWP